VTAVWRRLALPGLLALLVVGAHGWELTGEPVFDDITYILMNPDVQSGVGDDWGRFFTDPSTYSARASTVHYRPLVAFSYAVNASMGFGMPGFKLTELGLHLLAVLGLYWALTVLRRHRPEIPAAVPWVAAAWVAAAPFNVEAVHYLSARSALMCGLFSAWALGLYLRMRLETAPARMAGLYGLHLAAVAAALLCKETALPLPAAMLAADLLLVRLPGGALRVTSWRLWWPYVPYAAGLALVLTRMPNVSRAFDYLRQVVEHEWRLATAFRCLVDNVRLMVLPVGLTPVHPFDTGARLTDAATLACLALVAGALAWAWRARRRAPLVSFGWAWYFLLIAPSTFVHLNVVLMENRGYTASFGVGMVLACLAVTLWERAGNRRRLAAVGFGAVAALLLVTTVHAERVWRSGLTLWEHASERDPESVGARANRGLMRMRAGRLKEAEVDLRWAAERDPTLPAARYGLLDVLSAQGRDREAVEAMLPLLQTEPRDPRLLFALARSERRLGRDVQALEALRRLAVAEGENLRRREYVYHADPAATATELVDVALKLRRLADARWAVDHLRGVAPEDPRADYLAFRVALAGGDWEAAEAALGALARRLPGDPRVAALRAVLERARSDRAPPPAP
jgi:tetratricopeptide (TPR) repeat protein